VAERGERKVNVTEMEKEIDALKTWKMKVEMLLRAKIDPNFGKQTEPSSGAGSG